MQKDTKNHLEVEIRALVKSFDEVKNNVEGAGAEFLGSNTLHDIYFCSKGIKTVEEAEMHEVGSYSLRLRKYLKGDGMTVSLNTKSITSRGDHNAWEEHETEVADFAETARILLATEFKPFFELQKIRYEYRLGELNINLEDIKDFGTGVEVEILTTPGNETAAKERIMNFLMDIGITKDQIVPKSITNIVMKERAFKAQINLE